MVRHPIKQQMLQKITKPLHAHLCRSELLYDLYWRSESSEIMLTTEFRGKGTPIRDDINGAISA